MYSFIDETIFAYHSEALYFFLFHPIKTKNIFEVATVLLIFFPFSTSLIRVHFIFRRQNLSKICWSGVFNNQTVIQPKIILTAIIYFNESVSYYVTEEMFMKVKMTFLFLFICKNFG